MRRMTIRDIRLHWPEAERAVADGDEIIVTRDGRPVARILAYVPPQLSERERFDPTEHLDWLRRLSGGERTGPSTDAMLAADRDD
jgi:antitoxin (DNA-binding transcriptional repressor) of toxin-antitoxin stability system